MRYEPPVIGVDVDSSIWSAEDMYDIAAQKVFGKSFFKGGKRDWYEIPDLIDRFGDEYDLIFAEALGPKYLDKRNLYPGVVDVLCAIQEMGIRVYFITHNTAPNIRLPLHRWLKDNFGENVGLSITTIENKGPLLRKAGAFGLIDDSPKYLEPALEMGLWTAAKRHPWNRKFLQKHPEVVPFDYWDDFGPTLIEEIEKRTPSLIPA